MKNKYIDCGDYVKIIVNRKGKDYEALVDKDDFDTVSSFKGTWHLDNRGYIRRTINNKEELMHRVIMNPPDNRVVDHINGNKLNNRKSNLRIIKKSENQQNVTSSKRIAETGFRGVSLEKRWARTRYRARIAIHGKEYSLGYYDDEYEAQVASVVGRILYHPHSMEKRIYDELKEKYEERITKGIL